MGEVVIFPGSLDWCKIVIDNKLNGNVDFKCKCLILNNTDKDQAGDSNVATVNL